MKNYKVRTGCEIAGRWRSAGEIIPLTDDEARELAPPFGNVVLPEKEASAHGKLNRRKRSDRRTAE
ncbi:MULTISPECIES: hypothetical protein [Rhizobium/Agrobacterium group]|uniref:Uncharacterized protein n=1 Tax=Rhizobium rhizogenes TaxID=359 RepID=A0A546XI87_RHIRH|nr:MULTISPECIES: hypothetical protein [Rhizobium/Agrobacterium group]TRB00461.1 hypothetical protein EXN68_12160 [Rhizobium rhizogenes]